MDEDDEDDDNNSDISQDIEVDDKPYLQLMRDIGDVDFASFPNTSSNANADLLEEQNNRTEVVLKPKTIELDDDYYFLMSLLPHFQTMPISKKMMFRMKMTDLMFGGMFDD